MFYLEEVSVLRNKLSTRRRAGEYAKCVFIGEKLVQLHRKHRNTQSMNFADDLFNLAHVYEDMGNLDRAKTLYMESLRVTEALFGYGQEYADRATNLAVVLLKTDRPDAALQLLTQAEQLRIVSYGDTSAEATIAMYNIAGCLYDMEEHDQALEKYGQVLALRQRRDLLYIDSMNSCGYCHEAMGQMDDAADCFRRGLALMERLEGQLSDEYISCLLYYAEFCEDYDRLAALRSYAKAMRIFKKLYADNAPVYAMALGMVAEGFERIGDMKKSLSARLLAVDIMKNKAGGNHLSFSNSYRKIAMDCHALGDTEGAIKHMRKALRIKENVIGRLNESFVKDLLTLALLHLENADYKRLSGTLKSALKGIDPDDADTPTYYKSLYELAFVTGEMAKLQADLGNNQRPFSEDLKRVEALGDLFKQISDNLGTDKDDD